MVDIKISGRKVSISEALRTHVDQKIGDALKVFDITPMSCDVVLRVDKNPSNPDRKTAEVTVFVRNNVVRVTASSDDMYVAIDEAAEKVSRQLRKYKTKVVERRHHVKSERGVALTQEDLANLIEIPADLEPMTEEEALVQTDLLGHDFYVFVNSSTGLTNVIYHRKNGGYGIIKPKIEEQDVQ